MDYWKECISEAFDEAKIVATQEQIATVADFARGAHETQHMTCGLHKGPDPIHEENRRLKGKLRDERNKTPCRNCRGTGINEFKNDCRGCNGTGRR